MLDAVLQRKNPIEYARAIKAVAPKIIHIAVVTIENRAVYLCPVDSGNLRGSINTEERQEVGTVGTAVVYAIYVEYGTRFMDAQPFMRPAVDGSKREIMAFARKLLRSEYGRKR